MTLNYLQGGDSRLSGVNANHNQILESVNNNQKVADTVSDALKDERVEKWLVHTDPFGRVTVGVMGKNGKLVQDPEAASKLLGVKK